MNQDSQFSQQITLWNQQGSELLRGNLLVIPLDDSLLYVEAFFLQASGGQSKLPELKQVAVATQDRLATAKTFEEALKTLFPDLELPQPATQAKPQAQAQGQPTQPAPQAAQPTTGGDEKLSQQALQLISDYERLSAQGKHREAGEKLDQLKAMLTEMSRKRGGQ